MERFRRAPNEQILRKGTIDYLRGEQTFKAIMFHGALVKCRAFVTSRRFVACEESKWRTLGPLFFVIGLFIRKKIVFVIQLERLASISFDPKRISEFTLKDSDGAEFRVRLDGLFDKRDKWFDTISGAVKNIRPDAEIQRDEARLEFIQSQQG